MPGECCLTLVDARVSLVDVIWLQIIVIRKSQLYIGSAKSRGQWLKRVGGANRRDGGAIQWLFARAKYFHGFPVRHAAVSQDSELQRYHALVAQLHRRGHHGEPVALDALIY